MPKRKFREVLCWSDLQTKDLVTLLVRVSFEEKRSAEKQRPLILEELRHRRVGAKDLTARVGEVITSRLVTVLPFTTGELVELLTIPALARCAWQRIEAERMEELNNGLAEKVRSGLKLIDPSVRENVRVRISGLTRPASRAV